MNYPLVESNIGNYEKGRQGDISYIVIHYTANKGDTARGNCKYFQGVNRKASAHYFVDENEICQGVRDSDTAWHCGGSSYVHKICRNYNSIGIEMCSDVDSVGNYIITAKTVENTVKLVKELMSKYNITLDRVIRHYDVTGKNCPAPWVNNNSLWVEFKKSLTTEIQVQPAKWATEACTWAQEKHLINGEPLFKWTEPVSLQELALILKRYNDGVDKV